MIRFINIKKQYKITSMYLLNHFTQIDPDAAAFYNAVAPYDTVKNILAINKFVVAYKRILGISKLTDSGDTAIYPMYGGAKEAIRFNLLNPSTYKIVMGTNTRFGTFGIGGITGDTQSIAYAPFTPAAIGINNKIFGFYSNSNPAASDSDIGCISTASGIPHDLLVRSGGVIARDSISSFVTYVGPPIPTQGSHFVKRDSSILQKYMYNGVVKQTNTNASGGQNIDNFGVCGRNGYLAQATSKNIQFVMYGNGANKTDAQILALHQAIHQFQIDLGRAASI